MYMFLLKISYIPNKHILTYLIGTCTDSCNYSISHVIAAQYIKSFLAVNARQTGLSIFKTISWHFHAQPSGIHPGWCKKTKTFTDKEFCKCCLVDERGWKRIDKLTGNLLSNYWRQHKLLLFTTVVNSECTLYTRVYALGSKLNLWTLT